jgi:hypothetical protein
MVQALKPHLTHRTYTPSLLRHIITSSIPDELTPYGHNSNKGHVKRVKRCNKDLAIGINGKELFVDNASIFNSTTVQDVFESGLIGAF